MKFADNKRSLIASLLLLLFLTFQGGRMLCYHTHVFGNTVISHSHPFNSPDRQHSASELESIAALNISALDDNIEIIANVAVPSLFCETIAEFCPADITSGNYLTLSGRAPPFVNII